MMRNKKAKLGWMGIGVFLIVLVGAAGFWSYRNIFYWAGSFEPPENFDQLAENWAELSTIPGVVLHIEQDQEVIYSGSAGYISLDSNQELLPETSFHTASVGKIFTSIALLKVVEEGVIDIDDSIAPHVDAQVLDGLLMVDGIDYAPEITFLQLATHTSGLPNLDTSLRFQYWILSNPEQVRSPEELIHFSRTKSPVGKPGESFAYSSTGFTLLGLALEGATGRPYHQIVREEVLEPLNMLNTFESNHELNTSIKTTHHYLGTMDLVDVDPSFEFADGGFVTTADDLSKLGQAIAKKDLFETDTSESIFHTMTADGNGFGFFWGKTDGGTPYLFQPGFWGVRFVVFPEDDVTVIFTLNQSNSLAQKFLNQTIDLLIEAEHID